MTSNYRAAVGVRSAKLLPQQPPFIKRGKASGRFGVGVRYERQVQDYLVACVLGRPDLQLLPGPWFEFVDNSGRRYCQADAIILKRDQGVGFIYEIKYQHTADAWFQLKELYGPVACAVWPGIKFCFVEICHWHDPAVEWPERYDLTDDPLSIRHANLVSVYIWGRREQSRFQQAGLSRSASGGEAARAGPSEEGSE